MDKPKMLSGEELVLRGVTKLDATLPEIGTKDVLPNCSWLEQKQIQAALEARRHLVEIERIEKSGTLSHAEWREDLMLAEVTQQTGGYWQYLGHHVGKKLYLKPEEALFLMEVNCLLLKHNMVTVSLQKAYSLLLGTTISLIQYKVYASLSRLGYKAYRHPKLKIDEEHTAATANIQNETVNDSEVEIHVSNETKEINVEGNADYKVKHNDGTDEDNSNVKHDMNVDGTEKEKCIETDDNRILDNVSTVNMETENTVNVDVFNDENVESKNALLVANVDPTESNIIEKDHNDISNGDSSVILNNVPNNYNKIEIEEIPHHDGDINNIQVIESTEMQTDKSEMDKNTSICTDNIIDESQSALQVEPPTNSEVSIEDNNNTSNEVIDVDAPMEVDDSNLEVKSGTNDENTIITEQQNYMNTSKINKKYESKIVYINLDNIDENWNTVEIKIQKLKHRKLKQINTRNLHKALESIPKLFQKQIVTVQVPEEQYIPRNIFVNNTAYVLNLETVRRKWSAVGTSNYSTDEVNESHIRRLRSSSRSETPRNRQIPLSFPHMRYPRPNTHFRPYNFWRPRNNSNYFHFNMYFQRPLHAYFVPEFQYQPRISSHSRPFNNPYHCANNRTDTTSNQRKRARDAKAYHLQAIKSLAARLKLLVLSGNTQVQNIHSLQRLIHTYNSKYTCRIRLTEDFEIVDDITIMDTIELEDEEEVKSKKPRTDDDKFKEHLHKLRHLAIKLKHLEAKDMAFARHRRALSNAIKTLNKSFNADVYLDMKYDVIDRKHVTLNSSPDSDCVETESNSQKRKKLRNPFNILKRLSEKQNVERPSTSKCTENGVKFTDEIEDNQINSLSLIFDKNWLPNDDDFGRKEVVSKQLMHSRLLDYYRDEFLYEFLDNDSQKYDSWLDAKIAFFKYIDGTNEALKCEHTSIQNQVSGNGSQMNSLIGPEDCTEMPLVLEKLRIIKSNTEVASETNLCIDFDVYNRDVQNFRKSNRPKPHFRVVCVDESSSFPTAAEVCALYSSRDDDVCIVFAIVGGSSISYLQIKPTDTPVYIPNNDVL